MYNGVLAIWKPRGMTSHDVVFKLRKILKMKKIGHTGTLDPEVDGVLVVCLGKATRIVRILQDSSKVYTGEITLGIATETEDAHGEIIQRIEIEDNISDEMIDQAMASLEGEIIQIPPMYSAVKVNGRRLYEYARANEEVERPRRKAQIYSFNRIGSPQYNSETKTLSWRFKVSCGKGTYVRTLAVDLGHKLGFPAHMSDLTRLATSGLTERETLTLEEIQERHEKDEIQQFIYPIEKVLSDFPAIQLTADDFSKVKHGQLFDLNHFGKEMTEETALYYEDKLVAIYYPHPHKKGFIKPFIMFI